MYWTILVNCKGLLDFIGLEGRFGDEARMKFRGRGPGLVEIDVYDVEALWYKTIDSHGNYDGSRCNDDVIQEIKDFINYGGHDVIYCQRQQGIP